MRKSEFRAYTPAAVLLLGCVLLLQGTRQQIAVPLAGPLNSVLSQVDGYTIQNQVVGAEERRIAGMSDYVARTYWRPDSTLAFTTYVGYYDRQTQGKSMHSPKNCLPGAGWEILRSSMTTIAAADGPHTVNRDLLKNGKEMAVVYYWYQGRGRVVASEYAVKWNLLRDAALRGHTEEALVRLVVPITASDSTEALADRIGTQIAPRLLDAVSRVLPNDSAEQPASAVASADLSH